VTERTANVPCPGCACLCDDVTLTFDNGELVNFEPRCELGEQWFRNYNQAIPSTAEIKGQTVTIEEAVRFSADLLLKADYPLIYGLSRSATPGQRAAVALAERIGAVIDTTASLCHGPSIMAIQEVGEVTCTLGEVRNRADLIIFWGCHPAESHPRHAERYASLARGKYTPNGRTDRTVVMVGDAKQVHQWRLDPAGTEPDIVIPVEAGKDFETLAMLRMLLQGVAVPEASDELRRLLELMRGCRYGTVFFGLGIAETSMWDGQPHQSIGHINVASLLKLVAELNAVTRFTARRMRLQGDVSGADNVLCWQTSYPFGVDLSRGYPRYNPGEFTANEVLGRRDADLCLLVGAETVQYFSESARNHLRSIPTIVLDYPGVPLEFTPTVRFTTGVYGLHAVGTAYRMDNVPIMLKAPRKSDFPTDEHILSDILDHIAQVQGK